MIRADPRNTNHRPSRSQINSHEIIENMGKYEDDNAEGDSDNTEEQTASGDPYRTVCQQQDTNDVIDDVWKMRMTMPPTKAMAPSNRPFIAGRLN